MAAALGAAGVVALVVFGLRGVAVLLAAAGAIMYFVIAATPLMSVVTTGYVRSTARQEPVAAVVVLSSGLTADSLLDFEAADRLLAGIELAQRHPGAELVTTRLVSSVDGVRRTSDDDQRRLVRIAGLGARHTILDSVGTTVDEARRAAAHLGARRHAAIVTSPMHTRRACAVFESAGLLVTCVPARTRAYDTWHPVTGDDRLAAFRSYLYERLATLKWRWTR
jgi:uncharacterized SAM-binding protein YcdF (DUF218 family)